MTVEPLAKKAIPNMLNYETIKQFVIVNVLNFSEFTLLRISPVIIVCALFC